MQQQNNIATVIVAAGKGTRMKTTESKQYLMLQDKPIIVHTIQAFQLVEEIKYIVLVVGEQDKRRVQEWVEQYALHKVIHVVAGGDNRQQSVYKGLQQLPHDVKWVLVHDGVRPFVKPVHISHCIEKAKQHGAAVLGVPVKDTIKQVDTMQRILHTPPRRSLWAVQTPQAFRVADLIEAHQGVTAQDDSITDDAMLLEKCGKEVVMVEGDYSNIKITTPEDLELANVMLGGEKT
ncbi:2-C-methyl-D-erythritol 4-phosphate cytidylyltransferase [Longirhabdus pacifica]|uniref:2-C-methyl-D-erythritol 4-phosphate cytidylyltransferase n=1 Tax=Longirhabdus pacifica TaxID=2305227 RepID=UPI0010087321|nr:2-C-methyl-D-erythritol 4-phosphate cytidylyltransferase [Longirhabdus pacifica]